MSETLPECAVAGCDNGADPRWFVHTSDGRHLPACDGHGGLTVQDCNLRYQSPPDALTSKRGMTDAECVALMTASVAALTADLKKAEARIAEAERERSLAIAAFDEIAPTIRMPSLLSPETAPSLAEFCRVRYAREAEQWRANHDRRKEERDEALDRLRICENHIDALGTANEENVRMRPTFEAALKWREAQRGQYSSGWLTNVIDFESMRDPENDTTPEVGKHPESWLDCPECKSLSKAGAEPPRCDEYLALTKKAPTP